ncbi:MAG: type II toxin-antitoxin system VapC family toxin [Candidatus Thorarchaeota archaeon]|nr:type II toxin-antitoxin system VapC family toxin [Candidatus Thorarchaeota archaeon]
MENDVNHEAANGFLPEIERGEFGRMLTTDYVLDELTTLTMARVNHDAAVKLYESIMDSKSIETVHVTEELRAKAFAIFRNYPARGYSFTDCVSFALMKSLDVDDVFAFDAHFTHFDYNVYPEIRH